MEHPILQGRELPVKNGYLICPNCRQNKRLMKITPDTEARSVVAFCRACKAENIVDISKGRCFQSQSR